MTLTTDQRIIKYITTEVKIGEVVNPKIMAYKTKLTSAKSASNLLKRIPNVKLSKKHWKGYVWERAF